MPNWHRPQRRSIRSWARLKKVIKTGNGSSHSSSSEIVSFLSGQGMVLLDHMMMRKQSWRHSDLNRALLVEQNDTVFDSIFKWARSKSDLFFINVEVIRSFLVRRLTSNLLGMPFSLSRPRLVCKLARKAAPGLTPHHWRTGIALPEASRNSPSLRRGRCPSIGSSFYASSSLHFVDKIEPFSPLLTPA